RHMPAPTQLYTLSLRDALPICHWNGNLSRHRGVNTRAVGTVWGDTNRCIGCGWRRMGARVYHAAHYAEAFGSFADELGAQCILRCPSAAGAPGRYFT